MISKVILIKDLKVPEEYTLEGIGTTQSMISKFGCLVAYVIKLNRLSKKGMYAKTGFGSLFHDLLDKTYTRYMQKGKLPDESRIEEWIQGFKDKNPEYEQSRDQEGIDLQTTNASLLMNYYLNFYRKDFKKTIVGIEDIFNIRFFGVMCRGKIDGLIKDKHGFYWLLEHKTRARIYEDEIQSQIKFDFQSLFYITMVERMLDITIKGVYYNVIRNPGNKRLKGETWNKYEKRLYNKIVKNPKHYFKRIPQPFTPSDKRIFKIELYNRFESMKRFLDEPLIYKEQSLCIRRYTCDNLDACANGRLVNYEQLDTLFPELVED